jgi:hypothetical protein
MFARIALIMTVLTVLLTFGQFGGVCLAGGSDPSAPAAFSWLPHGYGGDMLVVNSNCGNWKDFHGFRVSPGYIGCWSEPVWGADVNGFWLGPNVPQPDPCMWQLPVGLIYPGNSPMMPPAGLPSKVKAPMARAYH